MSPVPACAAPRGAALRASLGSSSPGLRAPPLSRSVDGLPSPAGSAWSRWTGGGTPRGRHAGEAEAALPGGVAAAVRRAVELMAGGSGGAAAQQLVAELEHAAAKVGEALTNHRKAPRAYQEGSWQAAAVVSKRPL